MKQSGLLTLRSNIQLLSAIENFTDIVQEWNNTTFGNIFARKRKILPRLGGIQSSNYSTSVFLQNLEKQLKYDFNTILQLEEDFWKLKSRINWLNDGDANTKIFHLSTLNRRRQNRITALQDQGGNWITNPHIIKLNIITYYQSLFQTQHIYSKSNYQIQPSNVLS